MKLDEFFGLFRGFNYNIRFSDNVTQTGGPNDLGPTGKLSFKYNDPKKNYKLKSSWEIYVNNNPQLKTIAGRTNPNNLRIDALRIAYLQKGEHFNYGTGIEILGKLGGKSIQNNIHKLVGDSYIPANYFHSTYNITPTLDLEYSNRLFFNGLVKIYTSLKLPLITQNGIIEFKTEASHTFNNLYSTNIHMTIGLNLDCKKYPNIPAFSGYPQRDFKVCTPNNILSIGYNHFDFFWEIPLINRKANSHTKRIP